MARSADALQRRALKRKRTVEEQQKVDAQNARRVKNQKLVAQADGAWKCPACQTQNFASRYICHSKTCQEPKPETAKTPSRTPTKRSNTSSSDIKSSQNKRQRTEDSPTTAEAIEWTKPQASPSQIEYNQKLRQRYAARDPTLTDQEIERARILIARDERKREKKLKLKKLKVDKDSSSIKTEPLTSKDQRKRNNAILKRFKKTGGEGMSQDELTRAKQLLARKERKKQQHLSQSQDSKEALDKPVDLVKQQKIKKEDDSDEESEGKARKKAKKKEKAKTNHGSVTMYDESPDLKERQAASTDDEDSARKKKKKEKKSKKDKKAKKAKKERKKENPS